MMTNMDPSLEGHVLPSYYNTMTLFYIDIIYLDYAGTFDKVDINILAKRLKDKGFCCKVGEWIFNWLNNRTQQVLSEGEISDPAKVTSGIHFFL